MKSSNTKNKVITESNRYKNRKIQQNKSGVKQPRNKKHTGQTDREMFEYLSFFGFPLEVILSFP